MQPSIVIGPTQNNTLANTKPWAKDERRIICTTIENLFFGLTEVLPRIKNLIADGVICPSDFSHEKFNGCEIIP